VWLSVKKIKITRHAVQRMRERGCNPWEIGVLLNQERVFLVEYPKGFEILMPGKGRLAGDFDCGSFIVKTFLLPFDLHASWGTFWS